MAAESAKVEDLREKVIGNVEQARQGISTLKISPDISPTKSGEKPKHSKAERKEEFLHEGGDTTYQKGISPTRADVTTTKGEPIQGETKVYEHVHPVTVVESKSVEREEKPKKKKVHVVQHTEPVQATEVHRHVEPVEVVHKREVVHPHEEVYVHEHVHPIEVTEVHEHIKPEVHSLEKEDVYPEAMVKEKHEDVLGTEASRAAIHKDVDVSDEKLKEFDIKSGGMREKQSVEGSEFIKPTAIHHEKHGDVHHKKHGDVHHEKHGGVHHKKHGDVHHEKHGGVHHEKSREAHPEKHGDVHHLGHSEKEGSSGKKKKKKSKKKKHHYSDDEASKPTKTTERAPKV